MEASQAIPIRNKIIGILVKRARLQAGKTQKECAQILDCSPSTFSQHERGKKGLSLPQLEALGYFLDVAPESLWNDTSAPLEEPLEEPLPLEQLLLLRRKILAVHFRQCRLASGLSQQDAAQLLGQSAYMISQYEQGKNDIPFAELEVFAERCGRSLAEFADDQTIPLAQAEKERQILARLNELPVDVRDFVLKPTNALYLRIAMLLSDMKADSLRQIAELLLDITY
jgi:transcriptional regulator with XRE-family HTH domain